MESVIQIKDLVVDYGRKRALTGVSLEVHRGEIFGFLGPNGAGKSTTIKTLLGLIPVTAGSVFLHGLSPSDIRSREAVGFLPEEATYYRFLTPFEILRFYGEIFGIAQPVLKKRIGELLALVGLTDVQNRPLSTFSKGMVQKLSLAQALINDPETLILDEPTSGLDPLARMDLRDILHDLKNRGRTIFFSSHELSEVELLCDSIAIIQSGKIIVSGPRAQVLDQNREQSLERFFIHAIRGAI